MKPIVSVIIPVCNREFLIVDTLKSILKQSFLDWECIIVDDGSTDNTVAVINDFILKDRRFKLFKRPLTRLKGANSCRNFGFEQSIGKYIQWFDSDDIMGPDKLKLKVEALNKSEYDFVVCQGIEFVNDINNTLSKWDKIYDETPIISHITGAISFHTNGPLFKREFLEDKPLFNESLLRKQEWEFYTRLLLSSKNYYPLNKTLYYYRVHDISINGLNQVKTLGSRIQANRLVTKSLKNEKIVLNSNSHLRKHILNKFIENFKLSLKLSQYKEALMALFGMVEIMNAHLFMRSLISLIKKPRIIFNVFNIKNKSLK